jgi:hypothetical protein
MFWTFPIIIYANVLPLRFVCVLKALEGPTQCWLTFSDIRLFEEPERTQCEFQSSEEHSSRTGRL